MHYELFLTNILYSISIAFTIGAGVFVFNRTPRSHVSFSFLLLAISVTIVQLSHLIGINVLDAEFSTQAFFFSVVNIFLSVFNAHWIFAITGKIREERLPLVLFYISGIILTAFYVIFPDTYLITSSPKMYLPNYYNAGEYYWITRLFIFVVTAYFTYHALREYFTTVDLVVKNRLRYIIAGLVFAYVTGSTVVFLIFDIGIDPIFSSVMSLFVAPLAYATMRFKLVDINVVARQALIYALIITILTSLVSIGSFSNLYIAEQFPSFPLWIMPVAASFLAVGVGLVVWRKMRENDLLKYEFITVVTHKFRTPLTHVKWACELLLSTEQDPERQKEIRNIRESNSKLIDLTSTLIAIADTDRPESSLYKFEPLVLGDLVSEVATGLKNRMSDRKTAFAIERWDNGALVKGDLERLKFVAQTLIENAVSYTPLGGTVVASVESNEKTVVLRVKDAGIGISRDELQRLFTKFYRSSRAKAADTEGVGVGLFLVKAILDKHGARVDVWSEGENKGTTFTVTFPRVSIK